jgi:hypothetical protein
MRYTGFLLILAIVMPASAELPPLLSVVDVKRGY